MDVVVIKEFQKALLQYEEAVMNHDMPYILNRAGRNIATKASRNTPRATLAEIDTALANKNLFRLVNWKRKQKGLSPLGGPAMSEPAIKELKRRHSSRAYIAAGWTPAIIKFGGSSRAHIEKSSKINNADNKLASAGQLLAILENTAEGAGKVGFDALEKAIVETSRDMISFAEKRLQKTADKYSAK